jgi:hypothetical protein
MTCVYLHVRKANNIQQLRTQCACASPPTLPINGDCATAHFDLPQSVSEGTWRVCDANDPCSPRALQPRMPQSSSGGFVSSNLRLSAAASDAELRVTRKSDLVWAAQGLAAALPS